MSEKEECIDCKKRRITLLFFNIKTEQICEHTTKNEKQAKEKEIDTGVKGKEKEVESVEKPKRKRAWICEDENCTKQALFNYKGEVRGRRCVGHLEPNMIDVVHKTCEKCHKRPNFNYIGLKPIRCINHVDPQMINVVSKRCEKCSTLACFNYPNLKQPIRCSEHADPEMINITSPKCQKCPATATFNFYGGKRAIRCVNHRELNMVDVMHKKCERCPKRACFNYANFKKPARCIAHCEPNMVDVTHASELCQKCPKRASFNYPTEKKVLRCSEHADPDMINIINPKCEKCETTAAFNYPNIRQPVRCIKHLELNMVDVISRKCEVEKCITRAGFGYPHQKPTRCAGHALVNMISRPTRRCTYQDITNPSFECKEMAVYGYGSHIVCEVHRSEDMIDFLQKECTHCHFINIISEDTLQCAQCDEFFQKKIRKVKEMEVKYFLEQNGFNYISHDKKVQYTDLLDRPDFLMESENKEFFIVLEVDEHQHEFRKENCECIRMVNISQVLGKPTIFIRYNPDPYYIEVEKIREGKNPSQKTRRNVLGIWLKTLLRYTNDDIIKIGFLSMIQLFYDGYKENQVEPITILEWQK